jgi:hypothetical protein
MSWSSGTSLFRKIIAAMKEDMDDDRAFADVVQEMYPQWFD